jgi:hypothetical protein
MKHLPNKALRAETTWAIRSWNHGHQQVLNESAAVLRFLCLPTLLQGVK